MSVEFIELIIGVSVVSMVFFACLVGLCLRLHERGKNKGIEKFKEDVEENTLWLNEMYDIKIDERVYRDLRYKGKEYKTLFFVRDD